MKERLLKRIRSWSSSETFSITELDSNELAQSVRDDLEKLFNTRQGTVLIDGDFGMPDYNDVLNGYGAPDTDSLQQTLQKQARKYEKRLGSIDISYEENRAASSNLTFRLSAVLQYKNQSLPFTAGLVLNDDGSTTIIE